MEVSVQLIVYAMSGFDFPVSHNTVFDLIFSMSNREPKISWSKRISRLLTLPLRVIQGMAIDVWGNLNEIFRMMIPRFAGRRNRDFERAGRAPRWKSRRRTSGEAFRRSERERRQEQIEAEREKRRYARANTEDAIEYREMVVQRTVNVSRGDVVNHLAKINAKHRKVEASSRTASDSANDKSKPKRS